MVVNGESKDIVYAHSLTKSPLGGQLLSHTAAVRNVRTKLLRYVDREREGHSRGGEIKTYLSPRCTHLAKPDTLLMSFLHRCTKQTRISLAHV